MTEGIRAELGAVEKTYIDESAPSFAMPCRAQHCHHRTRFDDSLKFLRA